MSFRETYRLYFGNAAFLRSTCLSFVAFLASVGVVLIAGVYATDRASSAVTDIILSNTRAFDLDGTFVYGALVLIVFAAALLARDPKRIPFTLYSLALFFLIRAVFISLTHIGPFPTHAPVDQLLPFSKFFFGDDLFFSGHTGTPFLLALIFWHARAPRYIFLAFSVVLGTVALLAHFHYTIDVLAAFFITYTIFHMAEYLFPQARRVFYEGLPAER